MKEKIKNGYFFIYKDGVYLKVGSRAYKIQNEIKCIMWKYIEEEKIHAVYKANGELLKGDEEQ